MCLPGKRKWTEMAVLISGLSELSAVAAERNAAPRHTVTPLLVFEWALTTEILRIFRCVKIRAHGKYCPGTERIYFLMLLSYSKSLLIFSYTLSPFAVQDLHL